MLAGGLAMATPPQVLPRAVEIGTFGDPEGSGSSLSWGRDPAPPVHGHFVQSRDLGPFRVLWPGGTAIPTGGLQPNSRGGGPAPQLSPVVVIPSAMPPDAARHVPAPGTNPLGGLAPLTGRDIGHLPGEPIWWAASDDPRRMRPPGAPPWSQDPLMIPAGLNDADLAVNPSATLGSLPWSDSRVLKDSELILLGISSISSSFVFSNATGLPVVGNIQHALNLASGDEVGEVPTVLSPGASAGSHEGGGTGGRSGGLIVGGPAHAGMTRIAEVLKLPFLRALLARGEVPAERLLPDDLGLIAELSPLDRASLERAIDQFIARLDGEGGSPLDAQGSTAQAVRLSVALVGTLAVLAFARRRLRPDSARRASAGRANPRRGESLAGFPELPGSWPSRFA